MSASLDDASVVQVIRKTAPACAWSSWPRWSRCCGSSTSLSHRRPGVAGADAGVRCWCRRWIGWTPGAKPHAVAVTLVLLSGFVVLGGILTFVSQFTAGLPHSHRVERSIDSAQMADRRPGALARRTDRTRATPRSRRCATTRRSTSGALSTAATITELVTAVLVRSRSFSSSTGVGAFGSYVTKAPASVRDRVRAAGAPVMRRRSGTRATFLVALTVAAGARAGRRACRWHYRWPAGVFLAPSFR